jgi:hypothetical protein
MASKCGAKTRAGGRCQQPGMPNGRCYLHGGKSTGPKTPNTAKNAIQHGIYAQHLTADERIVYASMKIGSVEDELRLTKIRLARALAAETAANGQPELDEVVTRDAESITVPRTEETSRVRDYAGIIDRLTGRVESLEKTRLLLRIELGLTDDDLDADKLTPGTPDETPPAKPIR